MNAERWTALLAVILLAVGYLYFCKALEIVLLSIIIIGIAGTVWMEAHDLF